MSVELPCNHQADTAAIWKTGLEIELLAPAGRSRANLAEAIAERLGGKTTRIFYPQSEFSRLDNAPVFENLTLGYDVLGREGELIARCVDDLTIVDDLAAAAAPKPGWYRIVSDDRRWINLAARLCDPSEPAETVLDPLARLFATQPLRADGPLAVSAAEARAALDRACAAMCGIATEGGFLWRYTPDLSIRAGEGQATATQVWVQAPGTPAMGGLFLEAWRVTRAPEHLAAARAAALALVHGQLESGGWDYLIEFDPNERTKWRYRTGPAPASEKAKNTTTFDDDNTQGALRYLLAFLDAAKESPDPAGTSTSTS